MNRTGLDWAGSVDVTDDGFVPPRTRVPWVHCPERYDHIDHERAARFMQRHEFEIQMLPIEVQEAASSVLVPGKQQAARTVTQMIPWRVCKHCGAHTVTMGIDLDMFCTHCDKARIRVEGASLPPLCLDHMPPLILQEFAEQLGLNKPKSNEETVDAPAEG